MVRLRRTGNASEPRLSGVVERLGTAEKQSFEDAANLVRFLAGSRADGEVQQTGERNPAITHRERDSSD